MGPLALYQRHVQPLKNPTIIGGATVIVVVVVVFATKRVHTCGRHAACGLRVSEQSAVAQ